MYYIIPPLGAIEEGPVGGESREEGVLRWRVSLNCLTFSISRFDRRTSLFP